MSRHPARTRLLFSFLLLFLPSPSQSADVSPAAPNPAYCSDPAAMESRSIPPLPASAPPGLRLLQVHSVFRHGSRTPYDNYFCWNYDGAIPPNGIGRWDCPGPAMIMAPPLRKRGGENGTDSAPLLFEKWYDSLRPSSKNELGGTCHVGQLLQTGEAQERALGGLLREAYVGRLDSPTTLLNSSAYFDLPYPRAFKMRGDDQQRTLVSGQLVASSFFEGSDGDVVPYHTADFDVDPIHPGTLTCPRLDDLQKEAETDPVFLARNFSESANKLGQILTKQLGGATFRNILDCLMTQKCNKRPLPDILDDFVTEGDGSVYSRIVDHVSWGMAHRFKFNGGAYSKLAMGPMYADIVAGLDGMTADDGAKTKEDMAKKNVPMLHFYSGHDTTLMPMLASLGDSLWDGVWSPYASYMVIEAYAAPNYPEAYPSGYAFRLVYNGDVLTQRIDACDGALCDLDVLRDAVRPFATWERDCETVGETVPTGEETGGTMGVQSQVAGADFLTW
eukprot:CAMPEP_0194301648 /NCGR_PEP_ID=MMETSP0169-20130528/61909_1 /TAXON_ID=218684 /ORGANISM="Corethron pennatum, Strain L29A3" /LENGTH=502 /DNA_ID=CAMNT_0039051913 /DNA_START=93 /DNA_END=1598 /DNA_ORIENTATION=+